MKEKVKSRMEKAKEYVKDSLGLGKDAEAKMEEKAEEIKTDTKEKIEEKGKGIFNFFEHVVDYIGEKFGILKNDLKDIEYYIRDEDWESLKFIAEKKMAEGKEKIEDVKDGLKENVEDLKNKGEEKLEDGKEFLRE